MNGSGHDLDGDEPKLVQINANVGFSTKQVLAGFAMLGTGVMALIGAGWIALPAKQSDMAAMQQSVNDLRATVGLLGEHTKGLAEAIVGLQGAIYEVKERAEVPRARPIVKKPVAPAPAPQKPILGLF